MTEHYDVIIAGSGAGGGTLAHTPGPSGKRILLLERGDFLTREPENWDPEPVFVGGATKLYGAALYRLRPQDFEGNAGEDPTEGHRSQSSPWREHPADALAQPDVVDRARTRRR